jgi:hypothetical protein
MNPDFLDMLSALNEVKAEYVIVGAHAVAAHGSPRATGDLDIWIQATRENAERVLEALRRFGAPLYDLTVEDLSSPDVVFQIGVPPVRIDILTSVSGVDFDTAWKRKAVIEVERLQVYCIGKEDLIANKLAAGRPKDLADAAALRENEEAEGGPGAR